MEQSLWDELRDHLKKIGGKQHMGGELSKEGRLVAGAMASIKEETQIEQLLDMAISDFKAAIVEYKKRVDASLLHAKAEIAKLETDKVILRRMIVELRKEKEQVREIVKVK